MEVVVNISNNIPEEPVIQFLSVLRIPTLSVEHVSVPGQNSATQGNEPNTFSLEVVAGGGVLTEDIAEKHLEIQSSGIFLFNPEIKDQDEPKVIYITDHSEFARVKLEKFKKLQPVGFLGATVISEAETNPGKNTWNELSNQFLHGIKTAVQTTRANLIIANYDFNSAGRKATQAACLAKMATQNKCHVLILKT